MSDETSPGPCPECETRRTLFAAEALDARKVAESWLRIYRTSYPGAFNEDRDPGLFIVAQLSSVIATARMTGVSDRLIAAAPELRDALRAAGERLRLCFDALNAPGRAEIEDDIAALLARIDGKAPR